MIDLAVQLEQEARREGVVLERLATLREYADGVRIDGVREEAAALAVGERLVHELRERLGLREPARVAGDPVQRQQGATDRGLVAEVQSTAVPGRVAKAAAGVTVRAQQVLGGCLRGGEGDEVVLAVGARDRRVQPAQRGDRAAVEVGVAVLVDPRDAELAPAGVVERVVVDAEHRPLTRALEVGVLAGIEAALRVLHALEEVASLQVRGGPPAGVAGATKREREGLERAGLDRADLLEVRVVPHAADRVLIHATPHRVDQVEFLLQREQGPLLPLRLAEHPRAQQGQLLVRRQRILLLATPAADLLVIVAVELGLGGATQGDDIGVADRRRRDRAAALQLAGVAVGHQPAQELGELPRRLITPQLEHRPRVAGQHGGRRPAPLGVALGDVGAGVGVDADRREVVA